MTPSKTENKTNTSDDILTPTPLFEASSPNRTTLIALVGIMALSASLRLYGLGSEDYWLDELHSLANSAGHRAAFDDIAHQEVFQMSARCTELSDDSTLSSVWNGMDADSHPPIYFILLLFWRHLVGDDGFAVRLLSVLFSLISILPVWGIFTSYAKPRWGLVAAAVTGIAYAHIHIAQENRPYSLGLLFVSLSYWALASLDARSEASTTRQTRTFIALGTCMFLAVMTHYFTVLALVGHVIVVLRWRGIRRRRYVATVLPAAVAFAMVWGTQLTAQLDFILNQPWLSEHTPEHVWHSLWRAIDLPVRLLLWHERFQFVQIQFAGGIVLLAVSIWAIVRTRSRISVLLTAWFLTPVVAFLIIDLATNRQTLSHIRYTSVALPGLVGLLVLFLSTLRASRMIMVVVLAATTVVTTLHLPTQKGINDHSTRAVALITEQLQPGDLLVFDAIGWPPFWARQMYQVVSYELVPALKNPLPSVVLLREKPSEELRETMQTFERIILVSPRVDEDVNPVPTAFKLKLSTGRVFNIGIIYLFERSQILD